MSIHTDGSLTDFIFIVLVICLTFLVCEIITIFKIGKDKEEYENYIKSSEEQARDQSEQSSRR